MDALFLGFGSSAPSSGATNYTPVDGRGAPNATEANITQVIPHACTIGANARVDLRTAPGGSASWTWTLRKNGADTAVVITISAGATSGTYSGAGVSYSAGDTINWKIVPATTPSTTNWGVSSSVQQTATGMFAVLFGNTGTGGTTTTFYTPGGGNLSSTENQTYSPVPFAATLKNLYLKSDVDPGGTASWQATMRKNLADTSPALTCTISAGGALTVSDTTNQPTVAAGDLISIHLTATNAPVSSRLSGGFSVAPNNDGDACWLQSHSNAAQNNATNYANMHGAAASYATSEVIGNPQEGSIACTIKALYVKLPTSPGAGTQYTVTVRDGGVDTAATVVVSGTNTTGSITGQTITVNAADLLDISTVPASTPTARNIQTGVHYTLAAAAAGPPAGSLDMSGVGI